MSDRGGPGWLGLAVALCGAFGLLLLLPRPPDDTVRGRTYTGWEPESRRGGGSPLRYLKITDVRGGGLQSWGLSSDSRVLLALPDPQQLDHLGTERLPISLSGRGQLDPSDLSSSELTLITATSPPTELKLSFPRGGALSPPGKATKVPSRLDGQIGPLTISTDCDSTLNLLSEGGLTISTPIGISGLNYSLYEGRWAILGSQGDPTLRGQLELVLASLGPVQPVASGPPGGEADQENPLQERQGIGQPPPSGIHAKPTPR